MSLQLSGTSGVLDNSGAFIAGTAVASTSGTSITFSSIPSWVKRVTVNLSGVSTNGISNWLFQVGAGSVTTSGYLGCGSRAANGGGWVNVNFTTGFGVCFDTSSAVAHGSVVFCLISANTWACSGIVNRSDTSVVGSTAGSIALGGTLDRVVITTVNGTDTFDAGVINILYE